MAGGWNSGADRVARLRRVAIVLSSLPEPAAARLLGSMDPASKQAVRQTMSTLTDVDPLERQRAIHAFKVTIQRHPEINGSSATQPSQNVSASGESGSVDDLQIRSSPMVHTGLQKAGLQKDGLRKDGPENVGPGKVLRDVATTVVDSPESPSPLAFLRRVDDDGLAKLLTDEHPQTIAFVLASIAPDQAARLLPRLGPRLQQDTMGRIGRLGEIPETTVAEVAEHFRSRLSQQASPDRNSLGRQALDAILAAMPNPIGGPSNASQPLQSRSDSPSVANQEKDESSSASRVEGLSPSARSDRVRSHEAVVTASDRTARDLTRRLRVAEQTWPDQFVDSESPDSSKRQERREEPEPSSLGRQRMTIPIGETLRAAETNRDIEALDVVLESTQRSGGAVDFADPAEAKGNTHEVNSTDEIHSHLTQLPAEQLCEALGKVGTREAILTLCGLPVAVTNAALAKLPRARAKAVRSKMNSIGSLHLREIDLAKEKVAQASLGGLASASTGLPSAA